MIGMAIAIIATLLHHGMTGRGYGLIVLGIVIGGGIGIVRRAPHPDDGAAAARRRVPLAGRPGGGVRRRGGAERARSRSASASPGDIHTQSLIEMSIGLAIGAITFSGSLIAFAKLQALMKGAPITFPGQHQLNLGLAGAAAGADRRRSSRPAAARWCSG